MMRSGKRKWFLLLGVLALVIGLSLVAWRAAGFIAAQPVQGSAAPFAMRMGVLQAAQQASPTPTLSSEDIQAAPTYTTGIIILSSLVVVIIIVSTYNVTRRRSRDLR